MLTDVRPIVSTLRRHRLTATLLVLQIALTCAIVCNAVFLIGDRVSWMLTPSGIAEGDLMRIIVSDIGPRRDLHARVEADLAALRAIPGAQAVTVGNSLPFGGNAWNSGLKLDRSQQSPSATVAMFYGESLVETLGTRLVGGRLFRPQEYAWVDDLVAGKATSSHVAMMTSDLANRLFPGESAIGKEVFVGGEPVRVVGVLERLPAARVGAREDVNNTLMMPWRMVPAYGGGYFVRARHGEAAHVLKDAVAALKRVEPRRVIVEARLYSDIRGRYFANDRAMTVLLAAVSVALLVVTALGIVGLASFWVAQRRRQIGVRRALGASRTAILRYFQTENFLLASMGIALGMALAYGINVLLMRQYELPRLPWTYLPVGAIVLWGLGQAAVLAPALRAASVPPVVATRG
ncbi:FtsX-like permease family protein [Luteibacter sp. SG786]|uniref:ABC transporter permease n=1 Tax=Luteibacter sp. SG786 TaxID=2587130 RepID=UPI00142069EE|nr:FtsX-like permease family protein [Luteibacter sp. SG786]NII54268.1 putative ABC transport system permease protein [Luteibacter sp. SG786]